MATTKSVVFTASGNFTPTTNTILLTMVGAGGGGGPGCTTHSNPGAGGGAGEVCSRKPVHVTIGVPISVVIGAGGNSVFDALKGVDGGLTSFGTIFCNGGLGGHSPRNATAAISCNGGGSGGGILTTAASGNPNDLAAAVGIGENTNFFGGVSGGGTPQTTGIVIPGGACGPSIGGPAGITHPVTHSGGGAGGGSTIYGVGGAGGDGSDGSIAYNGVAPAGGSYGAGAGGVGGWNTISGIGGTGAGGYCLIEWME